MEVGGVDVVVDVAVSIRDAWIFGAEAPLSIDDELVLMQSSGQLLDRSLPYDCDGKLVALLLKRDGLLPLIEGASQQHLMSPVVPCKLGEDIGIFECGLVFSLCVDFSR